MRSACFCPATLSYKNDAGKTAVMAIDPVAAMTMVDNAEVEKVAREVKQRLEMALESLI